MFIAVLPVRSPLFTKLKIFSLKIREPNYTKGQFRYLHGNYRYFICRKLVTISYFKLFKPHTPIEGVGNPVPVAGSHPECVQKNAL